MSTSPPQIFARQVPHTPPLQANGTSERASCAESRMVLPCDIAEVVRRPSSMTVTSLVAPSTTLSAKTTRSEEHTSELQSRFDLVCRLLLVNTKTIVNND